MTGKDLPMISSMDSFGGKVEQLARSQTTIPISNDADNPRFSVMMKRRSISISTRDGVGTREPCQVKDVIGREDKVSNSSGEEDRPALVAIRASNTKGMTRKKSSGRKSLTNSMSTLTSSDRQRKLGSQGMIQRVQTIKAK